MVTSLVTKKLYDVSPYLLRGIKINSAGEIDLASLMDVNNPVRLRIKDWGAGESIRVKRHPSLVTEL